ncbi:MAG: response regulator [Calditrichaeota bacterium]|nr:MAG: response regulator [Calditrichota bacterium]
MLSNKHKILIVDDEPDVLDLVKDIFEFDNTYNVFTAVSGEEALKIFEDINFSLVLSDQHMSGMSGIEFLEEVKKISPDTIRIIMTGYVDVANAVQAINKGEVYKYITKPWDIDFLRTTVNRAVEHYEAIAETKRLQMDLQRANTELEFKVKERTKELEDSLKKLTEINFELDKANNKISESYRALVQSEKLSSLGLMAGTIAHDIKNPLSIISGQAQLVKMIIEPKSDLHKYVDSILGQVTRITKLVETIKNFVRKSPETNTEEIDLRDAFSECLVLTEKLLKMNNVAVSQDFPSQIPKVRGNKTKLEQVFMNIIQNAGQAMEGLGGELKIRCALNENKILIELSDTGPGIPDEIQKSIFTPFFTTKAENKGTGLGLSISQSIISEHKGSIELESKIGVGTKFKIALPIIVN